MATSEALVPTGQPQGERRRFVETARALGQPTDITAGEPLQPPQRRSQPGVVRPNFDVFADREPLGTGEGAGEPTTRADMQKLFLLEHPNPVYRDLARRLL